MLQRTAIALLLALAPIAGTAACSSLSGPVESADQDLQHLTHWMTGTFSSAAQAAQDPAAFFDIRLVMQPIWTDRADGPWLYVEQAMAARLDQPYRQRVYQLARGADGAIDSRVYTLPGDASDYVGAWRGGSPLDGLTPAQLTLRTGCTVHLRRVSREEFRGRTRGTACKSTLAGADHATSDVRVAPGGIFAWDRGWDRQRRQVWGPEKGAYDFVKLTSSAPAE